MKSDNFMDTDNFEMTDSESNTCLWHALPSRRLLKITGKLDRQGKLNYTYSLAFGQTELSDLPNGGDPLTHRHRRHINRDVIYPFEGGRKDRREGGR